VLDDRLPEGLALLGIADRAVEGGLGETRRDRRNAKPARIERAQRD
jgi:hypothetical protein